MMQEPRKAQTTRKDDFMEKLLDGVAVEWKALGDAVTLQRGKRLVKAQLENSGKYAVYQNSMTPLGYYHEGNVKAESTFIICAGAAGEIGYSKVEFWAADDVYYAITPENINDRFLFHFLFTQKARITGQVRRASIPRLSKSAIEKLDFPIPCPDNPEKSLAIQAEIVRILDAFTELTTELTTELGLRKKQYGYYRDQLLSFSELVGGEEGEETHAKTRRREGREVEWKTLGEVGVFIRGGGLQKKDFTKTGVGCIHYGQIYTFYGTYADKTKTYVSKEFAKKARKAKTGDLVIATTSENDEDVCKAVAWLGNEEVAVSRGLSSFLCKLPQTEIRSSNFIAR